jgi:hypothetical protein
MNFIIVMTQTLDGETVLDYLGKYSYPSSEEQNPSQLRSGREMMTTK